VTTSVIQSIFLKNGGNFPAVAGGVLSGGFPATPDFFSLTSFGFSMLVFQLNPAGKNEVILEV
jgi:hypothetical protein